MFTNDTIEFIKNFSLIVGGVTAGGAVIGLLVKFFKAYNKIHNWVNKQDKQDADIAELKIKQAEDNKSIKEEQAVLCTGIMACLDGLQQLGANHTVPATREMLEKHLNEKAHQ